MQLTVKVRVVDQMKIARVIQRIKSKAMINTQRSSKAR